MRLKIKKLGPVMDSEIELGDVTLFLGPPNTGKSYTLRAIYAKLFPLDDYALDTVKGLLSNMLVRRLEYEFPEHALSKLYELLKVIAKILVAISVIPRSNKAYGELERFVTTVAEKKGFQATIERHRESLLVNVNTTPIEISLNIELLRQILQEVIYEFTSRLVPIESLDAVEFEPIDVSRLDADYINRMIRYETKEKVKRLRILPFRFEEMLEFLYDYIIRTLMYRYESLRRRFSSPLMRRYLKYLIRYFDIELNLKMNIQSNAENLRVAFAFSPLRFHVSIPPILEGVVEGINLEEIEKIVEETLEKAKIDLRLGRGINRVIDAMKNAMLTACINAISRNVLQDGLRELMRSSLGYNVLRFVPFGRSILVLGIESASRDPYTRSKFLHSFNEFYPCILASYARWASKGRGLLLDGKLTEKQQKLLDAAVPLLEGKLVLDATGRLLYNDWRNSVVELQMSSALVEEVSGLILTLLSVDENSIILLEEPEAQLHPGAQIVMALFLASLPNLCKCKVVASTHSDLLAITLSQLAVQKPDKAWIEELIRSLLPHVEEGIDVLADAVAESVKNLDLRIYEFTREGIVKPIKPEDVMSKEVPGISKVIDKLTDWAFRLASYKASRG